IIELTALSPKIVGYAVPPVSWRVFATFFCLWLVGSGSAIYQFWCPTEVKQFGSPTEYIAAHLDHINGIERRRVEEVLANGDRMSKRWAILIQKSIGTEPSEEGSATSEKKLIHAKRNILQSHFDYCNRRAPWARFAVGACYTLGFVALAFPS